MSKNLVTKITHTSYQKVFVHHFDLSTTDQGSVFTSTGMKFNSCSI